MVKCGKIVNIILFFKLNDFHAFFPINAAKQGGDDKGQVEASVSNDGSNIRYCIADIQVDKQGKKESE